MTKQEFLHSTPNDVKIKAESYNEKIKMEADIQENNVKMCQFQSWLTGMYVQYAIACCLDSKIKYPDNPLSEKSIGSAESAAKTLGKDIQDIQDEEFMIKFLINTANQQIAANRGNLTGVD